MERPLPDRLSSQHRSPSLSPLGLSAHNDLFNCVLRWKPVPVVFSVFVSPDALRLPAFMPCAADGRSKAVESADASTVAGFRSPQVVADIFISLLRCTLTVASGRPSLRARVP